MKYFFGLQEISLNLLLLILVLNTSPITSYKIPNLENDCHYLDVTKHQYQCQNFNLSAYKDETIDINYDGYVAFTHASTLIFQKCSLPHMPRNYFSAFPRVQNVTITDCEMELKSPLVVHYDVQRILKTINFSGNRITDITAATFQNVKNLHILDLSRNKITNISGVFINNDQLEQLHLQSNQIKDFGKNELSKLINLKIINLSGNLLKKIDNIFENTTLLTDINLSKNSIVQLNEKLFSELNKLQYLNLSDNQIENLPKNLFDSNVNLIRLDLHQNKIKILNQNIFDKLTSLTFLSISDNKITSFGVSNLKNLKKLITLYAHRNEIETFYTNLTSGNDNNLFDSLPGLVTFDISGNPQTKNNNKTCLNIKFQQLKFPLLLRLNISSTNICSLKYNSFIHYTNLKWLDLSYNSLKELDWHTLTPLTNLRELDLSGNHLSQLEYNNSNIFKEGLKIQLVQNSWNCTYLMKMIKYFSGQLIDYLPPWHYDPIAANNIAGIECNGEFNSNLEDKAEEVLQDRNEQLQKIGSEMNKNAKLSPTDGVDATAINEKLQQVLSDKHVMQVELQYIDDFKNSIKNNFSFYYFFITVVLLIVIILSGWNFMTIRTLRNLSKVHQRVSFEASLLENMQA